MASDRLAPPEPTQDAHRVGDLRRADGLEAHGSEERVEAPPETECESTSAQAMHGRSEGGRDQGVAGVVVCRRGGDAELLADSSRSAAERRRILEVEALRDECGTDPHLFAQTHLAEEVPR